MSFYKKSDLVNGTTGGETFLGSFSYEVENDPTSSLVYTAPAGKQGTISIKAQLRDSNGDVLANDSGGTIPPTSESNINLS